MAGGSETTGESSASPSTTKGLEAAITAAGSAVYTVVQTVGGKSLAPCEGVTDFRSNEIGNCRKLDLGWLVVAGRPYLQLSSDQPMASGDDKQDLFVWGSPVRIIQGLAPLGTDDGTGRIKLDMVGYEALFQTGNSQDPQAREAHAAANEGEWSEVLYKVDDRGRLKELRWHLEVTPPNVAPIVSEWVVTFSGFDAPVDVAAPSP